MLILLTMPLGSKLAMPMGSFCSNRLIIKKSKYLLRNHEVISSGEQVRLNGGLVWGFILFNNKLFGHRREKPCLWGFANNTGLDQPAHPHSLISAFVIRLLESIVC